MKERIKVVGRRMAQTTKCTICIVCVCSQAIQCIVDLTREQQAVDSEDTSRFDDWKAQWS
jgi:hypothetical protein